MAVYERYSRNLSVYADNKRVCEGYRIRVSGKSTMSLLPDTWVVCIYNISTADSIAIQNARVIKVCGEHESVLCEGALFDTTDYSQSTNLIHQITLIDGDDIWNSTVNVSISHRTPISEALKTVLAKADPIFTSSVKTHSELNLTRSLCCFGRTCDYLKMLSKYDDSLVYTFQGVLYITPKQSATNITIREIDITDSPQAIECGYVVPMSVHGLFVGSNVYMDTEQVTGEYRLIGYCISADNSKGDWYCKAIIVDESRVKT